MVTDIEVLESAIEQVIDMLDRVSTYVNNVLDEETTPSSALGQFLMNTLSLAPKVDPADIERDLYVQTRCVCNSRMLTTEQQQPRSRCTRRVIPREHNSHSNGPLQQTGNRSADSRIYGRT